MKKILTALATVLFVWQAGAAKMEIANVVQDINGTGEELYFFSPGSKYYKNFENKLTIPAWTKKTAKLHGKKDRTGAFYFARARDLVPKRKEGTEYIVFYKVPKNAPFLPVPWAGKTKVWIKNYSKVTPKLGLSIKGYRFTNLDKNADTFYKMEPKMFSIDGLTILGDLDEADQKLLED